MLLTWITLESDFFVRARLIAQIHRSSIRQSDTQIGIRDHSRSRKRKSRGHLGSTDVKNDIGKVVIEKIIQIILKYLNTNFL